MIADEHVLWVERYRPHTVKDCILPDELKKPFQEYVNSGIIPNMILCGKPGTGKTTIARALCDETNADYVMFNGSEERGIDVLRTKIKGFAASVSLVGGRKVVIVDEADYLTNDAQAAFRGVIEEFAGNCTFIFTCNLVDRIIDPLRSRMTVINFGIKDSQKVDLQTAFFKRVKFVLQNEEIKYDPKVVSEVVMKYFPDYRRTLNELQHYAVSGTIDVGILSKVSDATYGELFGFIKSKNYASIRKWVAVHSDNDSSAIMRGIYDKLSEHLEPQSIPIAIILLGKYQYQAGFAVDKEINTMALLTELLMECQVK